jgi:hypothetical protein
LKEFSEAMVVADLLGAQHFRCDGNEGEMRRDDVVTGWKRHDGFS